MHHTDYISMKPYWINELVRTLEYSAMGFSFYVCMLLLLRRCLWLVNKNNIDQYGNHTISFNHSQTSYVRKWIRQLLRRLCNLINIICPYFGLVNCGFFARMIQIIWVLIKLLNIEHLNIKNSNASKYQINVDLY